MEGNNPLKAVFGWVVGLGSIALFLLIMVILFGNLSGNTGISDRTVSYTITGEAPAWANTTTYTLSGYNATWSSITLTAVYNATDDGVGNYNLTLPLTNVTVSTLGVVVNGTTIEYDNVSLSYTYIHTYTPLESNQAESVIGNYTTSATNTSAQFGTTGTILGIAILLFILIGVAIYAMRKFGQMSNSSGQFESSGGFG